MATLKRETSLLYYFCLPFEYEYITKRKISPLGSTFGSTLFQKGLGAQESKQEITKKTKTKKKTKQKKTCFPFKYGEKSTMLFLSIENFNPPYDFS